MHLTHQIPVGYLYSALEVNGAHDSQALFASSVNLGDQRQVPLEQLAAIDPCVPSTR